MSDDRAAPPHTDTDPQETQEWLDSLDYVLQAQGTDRATYLFDRLRDRLGARGVRVPAPLNTPYVNTIPAADEPPYPGNLEVERRIRSLIRWNAMAMVVKANKNKPGIGGHISTYASAATLYEVGFNHFFHGRDGEHPGDLVYFQGHAAPGIYARGYVEGRFPEEALHHFRSETERGRGLSSYPHPWLMPDYWEFPTVSMGLGPIMSIYQARFNRYLQDRGLKETSRQRVWAFVGDGEMDEPESLGALTLAARERLDNLTWVINCNLQRLDGPVRGNGKIIQELEAMFRGAGWHVIKVIWGSEWDPLLAQDDEGLLVKRMGEVVDGWYQKYTVEGGAFARKHFFGADPRLLKMVEHYSDEQIHKLLRGGHDPRKVYAAYRAAVEHRGRPTVILAKTVKGYGLGEAGEGRNVTHQQKKMNEQELREFRTRFGVPIRDEELAATPFYRPPAGSPEARYLAERLTAMGGPVPRRRVTVEPMETPALDQFKEFLEGSSGRAVSTTMGFARMLGRLLGIKPFGRSIVPIIPDEARTFGLEALFRQYGIYSPIGQLYEPADKSSLLYYFEAADGQILEEGITEAGAMCSTIAAGTAYATHGVNTIPFFIYYSMFGFQRVGDLIWAASDMRTRGFLLGATAGRTTLEGEGLQHQDGHSHLMAGAFPTVAAYDPAFMFELAVILQDGLKRMYQDQEPLLYYITLYNETYPMPSMPPNAEEGIREGMYKFRPAPHAGRHRAQILASGPLIHEALRAQNLLLERYGVAADVWSVTSYKTLRVRALEADRWNRLHPEEPPRESYLHKTVRGQEGPFIAVSDYVRLVSEQIAPWLPGGLLALGTDGFGRSDTRHALRNFFETSSAHIVVATLYALHRQRGTVDAHDVAQAARDLGVETEGPAPWRR
ncbi:pyruvate dehydrogenase (acetyl-transferring), homodimeric type [Nitrospira moscoviensis]|uniref:Pyruvate dehydrogenase E1 component n=1 Tax=Nitrospira moscoviensis TaxID=42253 RepID=A0A0K2GIK6_NITMO|nr:pyruvate dehydrogenase (acetyl-transferring), homodimeric type [Nitrospira moscoviensis]ALA60432.1 Pyruvate dehydrogenase E1 component (Transketolase) [Nitrospira moscoviensis]